MPGKVNPVIPEVVTQVAAQVIGNDAAITIGGMQGHFELNVFVPLLARNLLDSIKLLASASRLLAEKCVDGIEANREQCERYAELTLSAATALNPYIGYDRASEIVKEAAASGRSLREVAREAGVEDAVLDEALDLRKMAKPHRRTRPSALRARPLTESLRRRISARSAPSRPGHDSLDTSDICRSCARPRKRSSPLCGSTTEGRGNSMPKAFLRWLTAAGVIAAGVVTAATMAVGGAGPVSSDGDTPTLAGGQQPLPLVESDEQRLESDFAFTSKRLRRLHADQPRLRPESFAARRQSTRRSSARRRFRPARRRSPARGRRSARIRSSRRRAARGLRRDERPHRRARHPPEQRPVHPRRGAGRHLALQLGDRERGPRRRTTARRRPSERSRSRRPTTASSTPAPARARSRATRTSATASSSRPTAATRGRTSRTTSTSRASP